MLWEKCKLFIRSSKLGHRHRFLRYKYRTESESIRFIQALPLEGKTVLDIGANRGIYCYYLSLSVGSKGNVIAFEPQPECLHTLKQVESMFNLMNLEVKPCALSNKCGVVTLYRKYAQDGSASIQVDHISEQNAIENVKVQTSTLDSLADTIPRPVAFIKCDVEGHEQSVFEGAKNILLQDKPTILVEIEEKHIETVSTLLNSYGYRGSFFIGKQEYPIEEFNKQPYRKSELHRNYIFKI